jgi:hypothetical protein
MKVTVATAKTTVKDEQGREVEGTILTCSRCGETVQVFGCESPARLRQAARGLQREDPFYVEEKLE